MNDSPYAELVAAGCKIASHESDLYVKVCPKSTEIVKRSGWTHSTFVNQIDKMLWYDVPFAYSPWWEKRQRPLTAAC